MSANRLFKVTVAVVLVFVGLLALQPFAKASKPSKANHVYSESKEQALREYQFGERYGQTPKQIAQQQALREYQLGERYGALPQSSIRFTAEQALREYQLGERYGQTPEQFAQQQALREYQLGERYGVIP